MKTRFRIFLFILLPLLAGGSVYIACRPQTIRFKTWFDGFTFGGSDFQQNIPDWIIFNLPAGLWLFAFLHALALLRCGPFFFAAAILFAMGAELLQLTGHVKGTFDGGDLFAYALAVFCFFLTNRTNPVTAIPHEKELA